jgi:hypothetical protein
VARHHRRRRQDLCRHKDSRRRSPCATPAHLCFEQGGPSEKIPVVDLSSSSDEEFAKRLFDDLNHGLLGPPGDGKVIILSDSDEEEEVCEEDATAVEAEAAPSSTVKSLAPTAFTADADKGRSPDRVIGDSSNNGDEAGSP